MRGVLVRGEAGAVGGDLEEHSAGFAEVDRTEVVAVYLWRNPEPGTPDLLPPRSVLLVARCPESNVMHTAPPEVCPRRAGTFDHPYCCPRPPVSHLEGHRLAFVLRGLSYLAEAENLGEDPCGGIQLPDRQVDGPETPDPHLPRNRTLLPRNTALHSSALVCGEAKPLPFGVGEVQIGAVFVFLYVPTGHAEILETPRPPVESCAVGDAQLGGRDFTSAGMVGGHAQVRPVEEGDLGPRVANLVSVEEVVGGDVVLIHRFLYESQPEYVRVERHVLRGVRRNRRHVVQATQFHLCPPIGHLTFHSARGTRARTPRLMRSAESPCTSCW